MFVGEKKMEESRIVGWTLMVWWRMGHCTKKLAIERRVMSNADSVIIIILRQTGCPGRSFWEKTSSAYCNQ